MPNVPGLTDANGTLITLSDPTVSGFNYQYVYDTSAYQGDTWTLEARVQSNLTDSRVNFLAGAFYMDHTTDDIIYHVHSAAILIPIEGVEVDGEFAPLAYYRNQTKDYQLETWALFGEVYFDVTDRMRITAGIRYTDESKDLRDRQSLLVPVSGTWDPSECGAYLDCANIFVSSPVDASGQPLPVLPDLIQVPIGIPVDLDGDQLPNAPEFSVKLGLEYSIRLGNGFEVVPRFDYYWQDSFYYRIYNTRQDEIDSWDVMNASVTLYSGDDRWYVEAFVKNINNDDYITGGYFTDASSANFSNVFVLEPRTYGLTAGFRL